MIVFFVVIFSYLFFLLHSWSIKLALSFAIFRHIHVYHNNIRTCRFLRNYDIKIDPRMRQTKAILPLNVNPKKLKNIKYIKIFYILLRNQLPLYLSISPSLHRLIDYYLGPNLNEKLWETWKVLFHWRMLLVILGIKRKHMIMRRLRRLSLILSRKTLENYRADS